MRTKDSLLVIGTMTGNSLDGADLVLTEIDSRQQMEDLLSHSSEMPRSLAANLRSIRQAIQEASGNMTDAASVFGDTNFRNIIRDYTIYVAGNVDVLIQKAKAKGLDRIDLIGFHGQTCGHFPPSIAKTKCDLDSDSCKSDEKGGYYCAPHKKWTKGLPERSDESPETARVEFDAPVQIFRGEQYFRNKRKMQTVVPWPAYTIQVGSGQLLADLTRTSVVYDFRSDDIISGGEGAPLAPMHHQHLARSTEQKGCFPIAFCNAGNTGNISVVSKHRTTNQYVTVGWDTGPFNHYPDELMRAEKDADYDPDGFWGKQGKIDPQLLRILFETAAITSDGKNFLHLTPPRSSDPQWYQSLAGCPALNGSESVGGKRLDFADRIRTAEYFSAYLFVHTLTLLSPEIELPVCFALCGGGWRNPICRDHLLEHLQHQQETKSTSSPILEEHKAAFAELRTRLKENGRKIVVAPSEEFGFDGTVMEARIMADAAAARILGIPFTTPDTTRTSEPTICGILRFPEGSWENASEPLRNWLVRYQSRYLTWDTPEITFDPDWNRATAGWFNRMTPPESPR